MIGSISDGSSHSFLDRLAFVPLSWEHSIRTSPSNSTNDVASNSLAESDAKGKLGPIVFRAQSKGELVWFDQHLLRVFGKRGCTFLLNEELFDAMPPSERVCRVLSIPFDSMPNQKSLRSADAIEVQLYQSEHRCLRPAMPIDVLAFESIEQRLDAIRTVVKGRVPVGLSLPKGDVAKDVPAMLGCNPDFLNWLNPALAPGAADYQLPETWFVGQSKKIANEFPRPNLFQMAHVSLRSGVDAFKYLALGLHGVVIDLASWMGEPEAVPNRDRKPGGLLGDIGMMLPSPASPAKPNEAVQQASRFLEQLQAGYDTYRIPFGGQLPQGILVSLDEETERWTGAPRIGLGGTL